MVKCRTRKETKEQSGGTRSKDIQKRTRIRNGKRWVKRVPVSKPDMVPNASVQQKQ